MRALVLSAGGARGSWQAGAVRYLMGELGTRYDILSGSSVGAINAAFLAQYRIGDDDMAARDLVRSWREVTPDRVMRLRWQAQALRGITLGAVSKSAAAMISAAVTPSAYDTAPLREWVSQGVDPVRVRTSGRRLRIGAVELKSGERKIWTEHDSAVLIDAIMASSSQPIFFPPTRVEGRRFVDDGIREWTPIAQAIDAGATEIDVLTHAEQPAPLSGSTGLSFVAPVVSALVAEIEKDDLRFAQFYNQLAGLGATDKRALKVRVLRPSKQLADSMDFSRCRIQRDLAQGFQDAQRAISER